MASSEICATTGAAYRSMIWYAQELMKKSTLWRGEGEIEMANVKREDSRDVAGIACLIRERKYRKASEEIASLDSIVRDSVPYKVLRYLARELNENSPLRADGERNRYQYGTRHAREIAFRRASRHRNGQAGTRA